MTLLPGRGPGPNTTAWTREAQRKLMFEQRGDHLRPLSIEVLRDLARNPSAPHEWRLAAVEMLIEKHAPYVNHPDLAELLREIKLAEQKAKETARSEVEAMVEAQTEEPELPPHHKDERGEMFAASITTASLTQDEVVDNR